tara:strand:+ start:1645 stop:2157 length:513 start_codon:yes stop_codon:yes gene_type:complete
MEKELVNNKPVMITKHSKRKSRSPKEWEVKFMRKLRPTHGTHAKRMFHRLMKKSSTLKSSLKKRSKEYEVKFSISLTEIREMLYFAYNKPCKYCKKKLDVTNMVCDHKHPISSGGGSYKSNLQMICASCNTKKGPLTDKEYKTFINWVEKQDDRVKDYILRKLAKSDVFN